MNLTPFAQLPFKEAAAQWLEIKRPFVSRRTLHGYEEDVMRLTAYFADIPLNQITIDHFREYQRFRSAKSKGACINRELKATLSQILREADLWEPIKPKYRPIPLPHLTPGRALSPEEMDRLFTAARLKSRWQVTFYAAVLMVNTATGPGEMLNLQLQDVDIQNRQISIRRGVKNKYRVRRLDLNDDAFVAVKWLYERALTKGCSQPEHYLLPHRSHGEGRGRGFIPTKRMSGLHGSWHEICKVAGLQGVRVYDLRHTAITNLYSNPHIPERAIIEIAGWNSGAMASRYAHIRSETKRSALMSLATGAATSTVTAFATPALPSQQGKPEVIIPAQPKEQTPAATGTIALMLKGR